MGAEFTALMASMAPEAAAAPAAAAGAGGIAGGTAGLFGAAGAAPASAMTQSLLTPMGASSTPFFTEAAMATGMGSDSAALAKALSPETFSLGAPPNAAKDGLSWQMMAKQGLDMMDNGTKTQGLSSGQRPAGYQPQKSMQEQFAEIMGWLEQQGGRR
jgi:hypothetical protein